MNVNCKHHTDMPYCVSHKLCIINKQLQQLPIAFKAFVVWFEGELQLLLVKTVAAHFIIWKKTHQCSILTCRNDQGVIMLSNSLEWMILTNSHNFIVLNGHFMSMEGLDWLSIWKEYLLQSFSPFISYYSLVVYKYWPRKALSFYISELCWPVKSQ